VVYIRTFKVEIAYAFDFERVIFHTLTLVLEHGNTVKPC